MPINTADIEETNGKVAEEAVFHILNRTDCCRWSNFTHRFWIGGDQFVGIRGDVVEYLLCRSVFDIDHAGIVACPFDGIGIIWLGIDQNRQVGLLIGNDQRV